MRFRSLRLNRRAGGHLGEKGEIKKKWEKTAVREGKGGPGNRPGGL